MRIMTLMDNLPSENKALKNEHGLSCLVEISGRTILFDCGADSAALYNARRLGAPIDHLDGVVLSHSHYDHAGGFRDLVEAGVRVPKLYTGRSFFEEKYSFDGIKYANLSAGFDRNFLQNHGVPHEEVHNFSEIFPSVWLCAGFPRVHPVETIPQRFVRKTPSGIMPDDFSDEVCLALDLGDGLALLVGCSHPGILNMVSHVFRRLSKPVFAVVGGIHLTGAGEERIQVTVQTLRKMGVTLFGLGHCSGEGIESVLRSSPEISSCHLRPGDCLFLPAKNEG